METGRMSTFTAAETAACMELIRLARHEDLGENGHDETTSLIVGPTEFSGLGSADFVARNSGVLAGLPAVELVVGFFDPVLRFEQIMQDGHRVNPGDIVAQVRGPNRSILEVERTALNFLQHLSGIATLTSQYVDAVKRLPVKILDTRKTIPGWRRLAKYAVRQGGGHNHRMGLYDGILIKDNHLAHVSMVVGRKQSIREILDCARKWSKLPIEIEVDTLDQFDEALAGKPDIILLDNMSLDMMREAVRRRNASAPDILLEASGGINLQTVRGIAETGVDRISVGALTHSVTALDIGLDYA
jgi:nicotinate-nucleotide pyrophosphorylase (carboxylating)